MSNGTLDPLERHFRKHYRRLSNTIAHVYLTGIPYLEQQQGGLCKPVTANRRQWSKASLVSETTVMKGLKALAGEGLGELIMGDPTIKGYATEFRRFTLQELKEGNPEYMLKSWMTGSTLKFAKLMQGRVLYWEGERCTPFYNPKPSGRVYQSTPYLQGKESSTRTVGLVENCELGQALIDIDIKRAEPTVLEYILRKEKIFSEKWPKDLYQQIATENAMSRDEAKKLYGRMMYGPTDPTKVCKAEYISKDTFTYRLAMAVDKLKLALWSRSKPKGSKQRRSLLTLGGNRVTHRAGDKMHKGIVLNWLLQGTVADVINQASIAIIEQEQVQGWKYLFPVHDSFYVCAKPEQVKAVENEIHKAANQIGLLIQLKTQVTANEMPANEIPKQLLTAC